jgi:phosphate uptake regulator
MPPAGPYRDRFHDTLERPEGDVQAPGALVRAALARGHAPVASDLRLLTAVLHINLHLERIDDMAVNVARLGQAVAGAPRGGRWIRHLEQMSDTAVWMLERAADHAVDIAEQVWFLVTGELMEFDSVPRVPAPAS